MKTIEILIKEGSQHLFEHGIENPRLDAEVLLESILHCGRVRFYTDPKTQVKEEHAKRYKEYIKRRAAYEPVAYITGEKEFMGLTFKVTPSVLIPRPDTESIVEMVLDRIIPNLKVTDKKLTILDLCTGSGAIGLSLKHFVQNSDVTLSDISSKALEIAKENAATLDLSQISFLQGDLFDTVPKDSLFDLIISNPPYIPDGVIPTLQKDIFEYEPMLALSGGASGYDLYESIAEKAADHLSSKGVIVLEIGNGQENYVAALLQKKSFHKIEMIPDLTGAVRGVAATKKVI